jgi:hypothetical protein
MWRKAILTMSLALTVVTGLAAVLAVTWAPVPSSAAGPGLAQSGVSISYGSYDSGLVVHADGRYRLLVVDPAAPIQGPRRGAFGLADVRPGDRVEFVADPWAGMLVVTSLKVTPSR